MRFIILVVLSSLALLPSQLQEMKAVLCRTGKDPVMKRFTHKLLRPVNVACFGEYAVVQLNSQPWTSPKLMFTFNFNLALATNYLIGSSPSQKKPTVTLSFSFFKCTAKKRLHTMQQVAHHTSAANNVRLAVTLSLCVLVYYKLCFHFNCNFGSSCHWNNTNNNFRARIFFCSDSLTLTFSTFSLFLASYQNAVWMT